MSGNGGWSCEQCTFINGAEDNCLMCGYVKKIFSGIVNNDNDNKDNTTQEGGGGSEWVCLACTFINDGSVQVCEICQSKKIFSFPMTFTAPSPITTTSSAASGSTSSPEIKSDVINKPNDNNTDVENSESIPKSIATPNPQLLTKEQINKIRQDKVVANQQNVEIYRNKLLDEIKNSQTKKLEIKLLCPACNKPNNINVQFCTGCGNDLTPWDAACVSANVFRDLVNCILSKSFNASSIPYCYNDDQSVVLDDQFGVSKYNDAHLDVLPMEMIDDISNLNKTHIPLLKHMYKKGIDVLCSRKSQRFEQENSSTVDNKDDKMKEDVRDVYEKYVVAGFNYPVSVPHLHLHLVLPPFTHDKVFGYPRWHSFDKVISDLENFNAVRTFDKFPDEVQGSELHKHIMAQHKHFVEKEQPNKKENDKMETDTKSTRTSTTEKDSEPSIKFFKETIENSNKEHKTKLVTVVEGTDEEGNIMLKCKEEQYILNFPIPKDKESVYFMSCVTEEKDPAWMSDFNFYLSDASSPTAVIQKLFSLLAKSGLRKSRTGQNKNTSLNRSNEGTSHKKLKKSTDSNHMSVDSEGSEEDDDYEIQHLEEDANTTSLWTEGAMDGNLAKVVKEYNHAKSCLGAEKIRSNYPTAIVLTIPINDVLNPVIAQAIELNEKEPVVITLDFSEFRLLDPKTEKLPLPKVESRQWTTTDKNSFGIKYHLKEIVSRYIEDNWKWARGHNDQLAGAFQSFVSQTPSQGSNKNNQNNNTKQTNTKSTTEVDEKAKNELLKMGFGTNDVLAALKATSQNINNAVNWLLSGNSASNSDGKNTSSFEDDEKISRQLAQEVHSDSNFESEISVNKNTNFFLGLSAHIRLRLKYYNNYCMICHKKHKCNSEKPVVCCNSLCVFRYSELLPQNKSKQFSDTVDRVTICPFNNCESLAEISQDEAFMSTVLGEYVEDNQGSKDQHLLLQLYSHRYLNNHDVLEFVKALKTQGMRMDKIENVLKPELVNEFELYWNLMKRRSEGAEPKPNIAYHGTSQNNINSILDRGLLVPGVGKGADVKHATDSGWWGKGIYLSPDANLSIGYCRDSNKLLICAVLMGRSYKCTGRLDGKPCQEGYDSHIDPSGKEWIVFDPAQVIPCYLVSFARGT